MNWNDTFCELFERCVVSYRAGDFDYKRSYSDEELSFLGSIGYKRREFFDFIEDFVDGGAPSMSAALLIAGVRRDYFLVEQAGVLSEKEVMKGDLPVSGDELGGFRYLPRLLAKGRAKLRGELEADLMFGCGGDRKFFARNGGISEADFLRRVWASGEDDSRVLDWINSL